MNQTWPIDLREQLARQRNELEERINKIKADFRNPLEPDFAEQATQMENREVLTALAAEGVYELAQVEAALARLDDGIYGLCTQCGGQIDGARLEALPYANRCMGCVD